MFIIYLTKLSMELTLTANVPAVCAVALCRDGMCFCRYAAV